MTGHVVTVAQQKGGSGKTTLAVNLACAALADGKSVAVLDTDPQGSLGRWFMTRRDTLGEPGLDFATASAWGVSYECEKLRKAHDVVFVDTPPKIDADLRPALRESDLVIVPVAASHLDLWATEAVLELAGRENKTSLLVLNRATKRAKLTDVLSGEMAQIDAPMANTVIGNRVIYAEALGQGQSAVEMRKSSPAAKEIKALWAEVQAHL